MATQLTSFARVTGRKAKPTRQHRIVMGENMLGTVWAVSPSGEYKYFDYDWEGAKAWTEIDGDSDVRIWNSDGAYSLGNMGHVRKGQRVVYAKRK